MTAFYIRFEPAEVKEEPAALDSPKERDVVEAGPLSAGSIVNKSYMMFESEDEGEEGGSAAAAAGPGAGAAASAAAT